MYKCLNIAKVLKKIKKKNLILIDYLGYFEGNFFILLFSSGVNQSNELQCNRELVNRVSYHFLISIE